MPKPKSKCLNCNIRHAGCHGTCEEYKNYKKELDAWNQTIREFYAKENMFDEHKYATIDRFKKRRGRKSK